MRILLVYTQASYKFGIDGTSRRLAKLCELYSRGNDLVSLVGLSPKAHSKVENKRIHYFKQPFVLGHYLALCSDFNILFLKKLREVVTKEKINLVIMATEPYGVLSASIICHRIPLIYNAEWVSADMPRIMSKSAHPIERMVKPILQAYISLIERLACKRARRVVAISETDKQRLIELYGVGGDKITVIPYFVDSDEFENDSSRGGVDEKDGKVIVIFHGSYSHPANREAFGLVTSHIALEVGKRNGNIRFMLAGINAPAFERGNVKCLGFVQDLHSFLKNANMAIVPLLEGTGVKIKVFDYMIAGLPIIATKKALEGIDAENGKHAIVLDTVDQRFVDAVLDLAGDVEKRQYLAQNALKLVKTQYNRSSVQAKVEEMLAKIMPPGSQE